MELRLYLAILRRRWWILAALPLLVAAISGLAAARQPARYGTTARLLITRGPIAGDNAAGLTDQGEDKTALDLPAIISGAPFRDDLARELARQGNPIDPAELAGALNGIRQDNVVTVAISAARPADAVAIGPAMVALLKANGLRYWGDPRAAPGASGLNVGVLDLPDQAVLLNGPRAIAIDIALRALLALIVAVGLAFGLYYLDASKGVSTIDDRR
jgi:capsular polysaccharide biosynthesis protein